MWLVQSGMNSIITSMLSVEKGLDVSFCKCYFYNSNIHTNILRKALKNANDIAFLLGIFWVQRALKGSVFIEVKFLISK